MPATRHFSRARRAAIYLRDGRRCQHCGRKVRVGKSNRGRGAWSAATLDHCMRADDHTTVVTACSRCNTDLGEPPHPPPNLANILARPLDMVAGAKLARKVWGPARRRKGCDG